MDKPAPADYDLHPLISKRWSPYAFLSQPVSESDLRSLLEAARWGASSFNEQPWRFIVAPRESTDAFAKLLSCLAEANRIWAKNAGVLMLSVASTKFARNDKPNRHALHDVGFAVAQLTLQATALGLAVHQMAGFDFQVARELHAIPADFEPVAAIAIGAPGEPDILPAELAARERAERARRPQTELAYNGEWGTPMFRS